MAGPRAAEQNGKCRLPIDAALDDVKDRSMQVELCDELEPLSRTVTSYEFNPTSGTVVLVIRRQNRDAAT